jgi:hypothetical protein
MKESESTHEEDSGAKSVSVVFINSSDYELTLQLSILSSGQWSQSPPPPKLGEPLAGGSQVTYENIALNAFEPVAASITYEIPNGDQVKGYWYWDNGSQLAAGATSESTDIQVQFSITNQQSNQATLQILIQKN